MGIDVCVYCLLRGVFHSLCISHLDLALEWAGLKDGESNCREDAQLKCRRCVESYGVHAAVDEAAPGCLLSCLPAVARLPPLLASPLAILSTPWLEIVYRRSPMMGMGISRNVAMHAAIRLDVR